jgi:archaellin
VYPIRKGQTQQFLVTRAGCTTGISRLRDVNGLPVIESPSVGTFTLKAPVIFGPGRNTVTAGSQVIDFTGTAKSVRALPVSVSVSAGKATVEIDASGLAVKTTGSAAVLTFSYLAPGAAYDVTINGVAVRRTATNGVIQVQTTGQECTVRLARK